MDRPLIGPVVKVCSSKAERSILSGESDAAVHSMKDMETHFAPNTEIGAVLEREDRRDALVGPFRSSMIYQKGRGLALHLSGVRQFY